MIFNSPDPNVNKIAESFIERSLKGFNKYGVTTQRTDLSLYDWLQHLKEEMMDSIVYIERIQQEIKANESGNSTESSGQ